jgi:hypothetical protein
MVDNLSLSAVRARSLAWWRWLFLLPSLAVGIAVTAYFWNFPQISDGAIYLTHAETIWQRPFSLDNFTLKPPDFRFFSMSLLGLTYRVGVENLVAVKSMQIALYAVTLAALFELCFELFPRISPLEAGLTVLAFAVTPALLAHLVAVALDYIALSFHLLYLLLLMRRRWLAATCAAIAFAFSKETGFFVYAATLPVALWWSSITEPSWRRALMRPLPLLAPLLLYALYLIVTHRAPATESSAAQECGNSGLALIFSPNVCKEEIQRYLFNLFAFNFQWLLLIPLMAGAVSLAMSRREATRAIGGEINGRNVALVGLFLLAWIWAFTRCPIYNNVKYVLNAMPLWLLLVLVVARAALPRPWQRMSFLLALIGLFGIAAVASVDPLSRQFYGLFAVEPQLMFCMGPRGANDCGNDEIIYNLQRFM